MENPKPLKYGAIDCSAIAVLRYANEPREYKSQQDYAKGLEDGYGHALFEHAAPLEQLIAEKDKTIAELREALEPFAQEGLLHQTEAQRHMGDDAPVYGRQKAILTHGHFRRAAELFATLPKPKD